MSGDQIVTIGYSWEILFYTNQSDKYYSEKVLQEIELDFPESCDKDFFVHDYSQAKPYISHSDLYWQK